MVVFLLLGGVEGFCLCWVFFKNVGVVLANCFCSGSFLYVGDL